MALRDVSPPDLVFGRTAIGAVLLLPIAAWRRQILPALAQWPALLAYTAAEMGIPWLLLSDAERHMSSSLAALLVAAVPFVGAAIAKLRGEESLSRVRVVGMLLGVAGVAVLVGVDVQGANAVSLAEMAVVILGYAIGPMIATERLESPRDW